MLSLTDYVAALDEISKFVKQGLAPGSAGAQRLKAAAAAVAEHAEAHRPTGAPLSRDAGRDRSNPQGVEVVPKSRALRDLTSILRRQRRILVTRRGLFEQRVECFGLRCLKPKSRSFERKCPSLGAARRVSPSSGRSYPAARINRRRDIHMFDNANSVSTCAAFFAMPR